MRSNLCWDSFLTCMHLPNDFYKFLGRHALEHVRAGAGRESTLNLHVARKGGQNYDACFRKLGTDRKHGVDAAHIGQAQIHECYVRFVFAKTLNSVATIRCFSHQEHVRLISDYRSETLLEKRMIIYAQNTDLWGNAHSPDSLSRYVLNTVSSVQSR